MKPKASGQDKVSPNSVRFGSDHFQFRFQTLSEARLELNACSDPRQIMEIFLLTAMGTLGLTRGFVLLIHRPSASIEMVSRGLAGEDERRLAQSKEQVLKAWFDDRSPLAVNQVRLLMPEELDHWPFFPPQIALGLIWSIESGSCALIGFGHKILTDVFHDADLAFLLNLNAALMFALEKAALRHQQRILSAELRTQTANLEKADLQIDQFRRELDRRLLHLGSFYEILRELSGIQDTQKALESFLLSTMGIVGATEGCIILADHEGQSLKVAYRGAAGGNFGSTLAATSRPVIDALGQRIRAAGLEPMQAQAISDHQFLGPASAPLRLETSLIFCLDSSCQGFLGLGGKIGGQAFVQADQDLLLSLAHLLMVFLKNAGAYESVLALNQALEKQNIELARMVEDVKASRRAIETLERAKERFKTAVAKEMVRSGRFSLRDVLMILMVGLGLGLVFNFSNPNGVSLVPEGWRQPLPAMLDVQTAREKQLTESILFVDARPAEFFNQSRIATAVNLPPALFDFVYMMRFSDLAPQTEIIVYGRNISRRYDEQVLRRLAARGHQNVKILNGGLAAWRKRGFPMEP